MSTLSPLSQLQDPNSPPQRRILASEEKKDQVPIIQIEIDQESPCPNLMTTPSVNGRFREKKVDIAAVHNYFSTGAQDVGLRCTDSKQRLFGGAATSSFVYGGAPLTPNSRAGISEKEKNLSDQIRQLKKLMFHKEAEFNKDKAIWVQKYELANSELIETRERLEKQKNYYLEMIGALKFDTSPQKVENVRQSIMQEDKINEKAIELAHEIKNEKYESQIKSLKQKLEECEELVQMHEQHQIEYDHKDSQKTQIIKNLEAKVQNFENLNYERSAKRRGNENKFKREVEEQMSKNEEIMGQMIKLEKENQNLSHILEQKQDQINKFQQEITQMSMQIDALKQDLLESEEYCTKLEKKQKFQSQVPKSNLNMSLRAITEENTVYSGMNSQVRGKRSPDQSQVMDSSYSEVQELKKKLENMKEIIESEKLKFQKEMLIKDQQFLQLTKQMRSECSVIKMQTFGSNRPGSPQNIVANVGNRAQREQNRQMMSAQSSVLSSCSDAPVQHKKSRYEFPSFSNEMVGQQIQVIQAKTQKNTQLHVVPESAGLPTRQNMFESVQTSFEDQSPQKEVQMNDGITNKSYAIPIDEPSQVFSTKMRLITDEIDLQYSQSPDAVMQKKRSSNACDANENSELTGDFSRIIDKNDLLIPVGDYKKRQNLKNCSISEVSFVENTLMLSDTSMILPPPAQKRSNLKNSLQVLMKDLQGDENINQTTQLSNESPKKFPENYDTTDYVLPCRSARNGPAQKSPHASLVARMTSANLPKQSPSYKTLTSSRGPTPQPSGSNRQLLFQKKNSVVATKKSTHFNTKKPVVIPQKLKKQNSSKENFQVPRGKSPQTQMKSPTAQKMASKNLNQYKSQGKPEIVSQEIKKEKMFRKFDLDLIQQQDGLSEWFGKN